MSGRGPDRPGDFWSRRRAAVAEEARAETAAEEDARRDAERRALEDRPDEEVLEALGLKDPDAMEQGDDFSAFLKSEVPERLRRRALRRLWRSNPTLANLDGLNDYEEDFTDAATVVKDLKTSYQVGKGMLAHIERQLAAVTGESSATRAADAAPEAGALAPADPADTDPVTQAAAPAPSKTLPGDPGREARDSAENVMSQGDESVSPRRMRFVYDSTPKGQT